MNPTAGGVLTPTTSSADSRSESRIFINPTGFEKRHPDWSPAVSAAPAYRRPGAPGPH